MVLKHFIIGGEPLTKNAAADFFNRFEQHTPKITNVYGPTECCVDAASFEASKENIETYVEIPIGYPMPNHRVYIISKENQLQPVGVPGELCISGEGVARGYMNNPELTIEKFCLRRPWGTLFGKNRPPWTPLQKLFIIFIILLSWIGVL